MKEKYTFTGRSEAVTKSKLKDGKEIGKKPYFKLTTEQKVTFNVWPGESKLITLGKESEIEFTESQYDFNGSTVTSRWVVSVDGKKGNGEKAENKVSPVSSPVPQTPQARQEWADKPNAVNAQSTSGPNSLQDASVCTISYENKAMVRELVVCIQRQCENLLKLLE